MFLFVESYFKVSKNTFSIDVPYFTIPCNFLILFMKLIQRFDLLFLEEELLTGTTKHMATFVPYTSRKLETPLSIQLVAQRVKYDIDRDPSPSTMLER